MIRNPIFQILQMIDLYRRSSWTEFLDSLDTACLSKNQLGLILIDAINEGAGTKIWPTHMAGLLAEIRERPALRAVISCRSEYKQRSWPQSLSVREYEFRDFTFEEFERACVRLMDDQGIARPSAAFLPRGFYNPLFLSTACKSIRTQGLTQFPGSMSGIMAFIELYV